MSNEMTTESDLAPTHNVLARCKCGGRGGMWHRFEDSGARLAQVECRNCHRKGTAVPFDAGHKPHIAAERAAASNWNESMAQ